MTQSGKHGNFIGIRWNLLKMCTINSKFLETTPNGPSVILDKFEDHWSEASPKMTQPGNHGMIRGNFS